MGAGDFFVHWFLWLLSPAERAALALGGSPRTFNFKRPRLGLGGPE